MADSVNDDPQDPAQKSMADILVNLPAVRAAKKANTMSRVHRRLIAPLETDQDDEQRLAFQHTVFCQTGFRTAIPATTCASGSGARARCFVVQAGHSLQPARPRIRSKLGLPWGTKPRLILAHLNAEALRQGSPVIEVESSLSAFVKRIRGFDSGREIRASKTSSPACRPRSSALPSRAAITAYQVEHQGHHRFRSVAAEGRAAAGAVALDHPAIARLLHSLQEHAVPLNEADLAALAHSAMALDLYAWLAQRLHRVNPNRPAFIQWAALKQQFGPDYGRMGHFKRIFRKALRQVLTRYKAARIELDGSRHAAAQQPAAGDEAAGHAP